MKTIILLATLGLALSACKGGSSGDALQPLSADMFGTYTSAAHKVCGTVNGAKCVDLNSCTNADYPIDSVSCNDPLNPTSKFPCPRKPYVLHCAGGCDVISYAPGLFTFGLQPGVSEVFPLVSYCFQ